MKNIHTMIRGAVIIVFFVVLFAGEGWCGWELQKPAGTPDLNDIAFIDELHGWAVGDSSLILATADGGETWVKQECPVDNVNWDTVYPVSNDKIFCIDNYEIPSKPDNTGLILVTDDGGSNWAVLDTNFKPKSSTCTLSFLSESKGWAAVGNGIWTTEDGGSSWVQVSVAPDQNIFIYGFTMYDDNRGCLTTGPFIDSMCSLDIYTTEDGAHTWGKKYTIDNGAAQKGLSYIPPETIWIEAGIRLYRSCDGGTSWNYIFFDSDLGYYNQKRFLHFQPFSGISSGCCGYAFYTFNGETTGFVSIDFEKQEVTELEQGPSLSPDYPRYVASSSKTYWTISYLSNEIWRYTPETSAAVSEKPEPVALKINNYPNPFNPTTTISFSLPTPVAVTVSVHDVSGQKVATLVDRNMPAGRHSVVFDGSSLASGVYFYRLETPGFAKTGKMLLVK